MKYKNRLFYHKWFAHSLCLPFFCAKKWGGKRGKTMERKKFLTILRELNQVCHAVNEEELEERGDMPVIYEVLQFSDLARKWNSVYKITDFYNHNWLGNIDFMHIPDFRQTLENCQSYPMIIARERDSERILGISTIKYDENTAEKVDPYFPEPGAKYFSITGILVRKDNPYRGIGKKIYEIALRGAYQYENIYPGTKMMCVIDCRNGHSLKALASAAQRVKEGQKIGENVELPVHILGYYELRDKENSQLLEAPTLVAEIDLAGRSVHEYEEGENRLNFQKSGTENELYQSLLNTLKSQFGKYGLEDPIIQEDVGCGMVSFTSLREKEHVVVQSVCIEANGTEQGKDRQPRDDSEMRQFMGPIPGIAQEEEENEK